MRSARSTPRPREQGSNGSIRINLTPTYNLSERATFVIVLFCHDYRGLYLGSGLHAGDIQYRMPI